MNGGRWLIVVLVSALLGGCQSGGGLIRQDDSQADRIRQLQRELVEARQRAVMAEVEAERLESRVDQLERELREARSRALEAPPARNAGEVIEDIPLDETPSRAEIEEVELEEPEPEEPEPEEVELRPEPEMATPGTSTSPGGSSAAESTQPTGDGESAQALYDAAYTLFHEKRYAEAESAFKRFLGRHSQSHLADNAQFWIGESRWARGDFSSALSAFMATVEGYPHGNKVADALLKAGRCLEALGQKSRAVATYEELVTRFPQSAAAISAQERLGDLRR